MLCKSDFNRTKEKIKIHLEFEFEFLQQNFAVIIVNSPALQQQQILVPTPATSCGSDSYIKTTKSGFPDHNVTQTTLRIILMIYLKNE